ncbi:hypothetical protein V500_03869 [Pseudogymnoascus sp. VKM F-4518 (FW-2643)]|nr:hypothetical protein V500_03869 [Pseudogymnoascus sp. VKM F-4518 (FW-2643)]
MSPPSCSPKKCLYNKESIKPSQLPRKASRSKRQRRKTESDNDEEYYEPDEQPATFSGKRLRRNRDSVIDNIAEDPDFDQEDEDDADLIDHPSFLTSKVQTRAAAARVATEKNLDLDEQFAQDTRRREFLDIYETTVEPVTTDTWTRFIRAIPADIRGTSHIWVQVLADAIRVKTAKEEEAKEEEAKEEEAKDNIKEEGQKDVKLESKEDIDLEDIKMEDTGTREEKYAPSQSVSPFAALPHLWENLEDVQKPQYNDDDISDISGEGETDLSESEHEDEFYSQPEPQSFVDTVKQVQHWLAKDPARHFQQLKIHNGPRALFGNTAIVFGVPVEVASETNFIPHGFPLGSLVEEVAGTSGFRSWVGFREISQALFFYYGTLHGWAYRELLPDAVFWLSFDGCTLCDNKCNCWWSNMRTFRRELESSITKRMVIWVSQVIDADTDKTMRSVVGMPRPSRQKFWEEQLQAADILKIFEPLRPGVDIQAIVDSSGGDDLSEWKRWLCEAAAWLADDVYGYHVAQGGLEESGADVPRVVVERFGKLRDFVLFRYVPSIKTLPIRANFRSPLYG